MASPLDIKQAESYYRKIYKSAKNITIPSVQKIRGCNVCTAGAVMATEKIDLNIKRTAASLKYLVVTQNKLIDSMGHLSDGYQT